MGHPGLALRCLDWLLGGCTACTESVGVHWDRFTQVEQLYASCPWAVDERGMVLVFPVIFSGVGGAVFLRLAWVLRS